MGAGPKRYAGVLYTAAKSVVSMALLALAAYFHMTAGAVGGPWAGQTPAAPSRAGPPSAASATTAAAPAAADLHSQSAARPHGAPEQKRLAELPWWQRQFGRNAPPNATAAAAAPSAAPFHDPTPPGCPRRFFSFANNFGGHNNQLISLLNAFALAKDLNVTLVIPPFWELQTNRYIKPTKYYNFSLFLQEFCAVMVYEPAMGPLRKQAAYKLFRVLPRNASRPYHLLRPAARLEAEIARTLARLPAAFTAVHRRTELRRLYGCHVPHTANHTPRPPPEDSRAGEGGGEDPRLCAGEVRPPHCCMYLPYIRAAQQEAGMSTTDPFFVATDNPFSVLNARYVRYTGRFGTTAAVVVDFFVLTRAALFLGNPSSSLAMNVCLYRKALRPPRGCHRFRFCKDRHPFIGSWPCDTPVEGIAYSA